MKFYEYYRIVPFLAIGEILQEKRDIKFILNKIIDKMGTGPKGIRIDKINTKNLKPKILELMNNSSFKKKAEQAASKLKKEDFREELYNAIVE